MSTTPARPTETAEIREALAPIATWLAARDGYSFSTELNDSERESFLDEAVALGTVAALAFGEIVVQRDTALAERDEARRQTNRTKEVMLRFGLRFIRRERLQVESCRSATAQAERTAGELAAAKAEALKLADDFEQSGGTLYRPEQYPPGYERGWKEAHAYCAKDLRTLAALTEEAPHAE